MSTPAITAPSSVNWDRLQPVVQCPGCGQASLELRRADVLCAACAAVYPIVDGVVDFVGATEADVPRFYRNAYYRRFIESLDAVHAAHYEESSFSARLERAMKRDLFRLVLPGPGPSVDLGCGLGGGFAYIGRDADVIGLDLSLPLLRATKRLHPEATIVRADLARLPFRPGSLARVFANAVLEHVFRLEAAVEEIERCLAPTGFFYAGFPTEGSLAVAAARMVTSQRNSRIIGLTPAQSRIAQRIDHCNSVFGLDNAVRKHFAVDARSFWPFHVPSRNMNLSVSYRLRLLSES